MPKHQTVQYEEQCVGSRNVGTSRLARGPIERRERETRVANLVKHPSPLGSNEINEPRGKGDTKMR